MYFGRSNPVVLLILVAIIGGAVAAGVHTARVASVRNRVPTPVMLLEIVGSAVAIGVLALYLTMIGRRITPSVLSAAFVILILFVTFDLDRPQRGMITVPFGPLEDVRASMDEPPAASP